MPRAKETTLELDLVALEHNYNYIRTKIHPSTMFLAVVKAFAYGSDSVIIAKKLEKQVSVNDFPLIILCDDPAFCAADFDNFLWLTFTRSGYIIRFLQSNLSF